MELRILVSFHYYRTDNLEKHAATCAIDGALPDVFADCGAFSAKTQGAEIELPAYAAWIARWGSLFTVYANLDVIGDPVATAANQATLEAHGLAPLPVFHAGSPWGVLDEMADRYRYIALGNLVGRRTKVLLPWLAHAFRLVNGRAALHGFGVTSWEALASFPFYSVDSSGWGSGYRYGVLRLFDPDCGRMRQIQLGDRRGALAYSRLLAYYGMTTASVKDRAQNTRQINAALGALSMAHAEHWLRRRHGMVTLPDGDKPFVRTAASPRLYCADTDPYAFRKAATGIRTYLAASGITMHREARDGLRAYLADASMTNIRAAARGLTRPTFA